MKDMKSNAFITLIKIIFTLSFLYSRLGAQVAYRSHRSELSSDIELSQANFYSAELSAG